MVQAGSTHDLELLQMAVKMPDALKVDREELNDEEWFQISNHIEEAIKENIQYRMDEATSLEEDFKLRIKNIQLYLEEIKSFDLERNLCFCPGTTFC